MTIKDSAELVAWLTAAGPQPESGYALGQLESYSPVQVSFDGEVDDNGNRIVNPATIVLSDGCFPIVGNRVLMHHVGNSWVITETLNSTDVSPGSPRVGWTALGSHYAANVGDIGSPYDGGAFIKINGIVHLRGVLKVTGTIATNGALFTVPTGYGMIQGVNPSGADRTIFTCTSARGTTVMGMRLQIGPTDNYTISLGASGQSGNTLVSGDNFCISGISWPADC